MKIHTVIILLCLVTIVVSNRKAGKAAKPKRTMDFVDNILADDTLDEDVIVHDIANRDMPIEKKSIFRRRRLGKK